jgi:carotenoid 1,2-hydratase
MNHFELPEKSGAYRWYYIDVTAGDTTAVFIFMVGSIFSARYSTSLKKGGLPQHHAAVNFALYEKGIRTRWVLTEYGAVTLSPDAKRLTIGNSFVEYRDGGLVAEVKDKTTPFWATGWGSPTEVKLELRPEGPLGTEVELVSGLSHRWRPIAAKAHARVTLDDEGRSFEGRGYHDANHGAVPLGTDLRGWDWVRVHHPQSTEITYRPWVDGSAHQVTIDASSFRLAHAELGSPPTKRTTWGLAVPQSLGFPGEPRLLESSPFYARLETEYEGVHAMGEVADFQRFHSPAVRWMANFKTRKGSAA